MDPFLLQVKTPSPAHGFEIQKGGDMPGGPMSQMPKQNKKVHIKPGTGEDVPKQRSMTGTGCRAFLVRKYLRPRATLPGRRQEAYVTVFRNNDF